MKLIFPPYLLHVVTILSSNDDLREPNYDSHNSRSLVSLIKNAQYPSVSLNLFQHLIVYNDLSLFSVSKFHKKS